MKRITTLFAALVATVAAVGQNGYTQYRLPGIAQTSALNPAFAPNTQKLIGLPGLNGMDVRLAHNGFVLSDVITIRPDDSLVVNIDGMINALDDRNLISFDLRTDLLTLGFGGETFFLSAAITERAHFRFGYPRDLMVLAWEGNGQSLLGERASLDDFGLDFTAYREYAFGASVAVSPRLKIGVRGKYLQGRLNAFTRTSRFGMHTDAQTFALSFDGEGEINTSGIQELADSTEFDPANLWRSRGNNGWGLDLGADWRFSEKMSFSASVIDIGSILWKHNTRTYSAERFTYEFIGLNVNDALTDSTDIFETLLDSLENLVETGEFTGNYRTPLNPRIFLSASYHLSERISLGALFHGELYRGTMIPTAVASFDVKINRWFGSTVNWAYTNRRFNNLGVGFYLHGGPVQFYMVTDNLLAPFLPQHATGIQANFGLNLAIGRRFDTPSN